MPLLTRVKKFNFISPRDLTSKNLSYPKSHDALPLRVISYVKPLTLYPPEESKDFFPYLNSRPDITAPTLQMKDFILRGGFFLSE